MANPDQGFVVRRCRLRDASSISDLLKVCWHATYDPILGRPQALRSGRRIYSKLYWRLSLALSSWTSRALTLLVATQDGFTVGLATAQRDGAEIILYALYVHPDWKGRGVGSSLMDAVIADHADAKVIRLEVLTANIAAIAWYKSKGFAIYGGTENATGMAHVPALYMDKAIDRIASPA